MADTCKSRRRARWFICGAAACSVGSSGSWEVLAQFPGSYQTSYSIADGTPSPAALPPTSAYGGYPSAIELQPAPTLTVYQQTPDNTAPQAAAQPAADNGVGETPAGETRPPELPAPGFQAGPGEAATEGVTANEGDATEADADAESQGDEEEVSLEDLQAKYDQLEADFTAFSKKKFVLTGSSNATMRFGGRIHLDAWGFAEADPVIATPAYEGFDPQNRLGFRRIRPTVAGDIGDNMIYKVDMEIAEGADPGFRDVYLGWTELPMLQTVILGNHKRPYGLDHINSSRYNVFLERPLIVELFNEDARRLGLSSNGVTDDLRYNWRYGVYNQQNIQRSGVYLGDPLQLELAGRLATTAWYDEISGGRGYAHFAIAGTAADPTDDAITPTTGRFFTRPEARSVNRWIDTGRIADIENYEMLAFESVVNVGALQLVGEYQTAQVNRIDGRNDTNFDGFYVYGAYFLTGEHMPWDRESGELSRIHPFENFWVVDRCGGGHSAGWGAWQVAARYSEADFTDDDIFGGVGEAVTYALNWYWNPNARLQVNYINGTISERSAARLAGDYQIYGARASIDW